MNTQEVPLGHGTVHQPEPEGLSGQEQGGDEGRGGRQEKASMGGTGNNFLPCLQTMLSK